MTGRIGRLLRDDRGAAAAELAVALPAVVLALLLGTSALGAATQQVLLQDAVADSARLLGRGESVGRAVAAVTGAVGGAQVSPSDDGELACVSARTEHAVGGVIRIPLHAASCALSGGR